MEFNLKDTREWKIPYDGNSTDVLKVVDPNGITLWEKYYYVKYDDNLGETNKYTVTFDANGGTGTGIPSVTVDKGATIYLPDPSSRWTRSGYSLDADHPFNLAPDGSETGYAAGQAFKPTHDTVLYARWKSAQWTITFNANGGTGTMASRGASYNELTYLPNCSFTKAGYDFEEWNFVVGSESRSLTDGASFIMPNQDIQLTAQWQAATYNLIVRPNNNSTAWPGMHDAHLPGKGTGIGETLSMTYGQLYPTLPLPVATGFTFYQWYYVTEDNQRDYLPARPDGQITGNVNFTCNTTIWAQWQANIYTMTFDKQGGSSGTTTATATYGKLIPNITIPTLANKYFNGYYEGTNGTGKQYYDAYGKGLVVWNLTTTITLYAYWTDSYSDPLLITDANELVQTTDGDFILT